MKRPKYKELEFKILELLVTRADCGILPRTNLQTECDASKSSMSDVLADLEKQGLVTRIKWFGNQERVKITEKGRKEYNQTRTERLSFPVPYVVQLYLNRRKPPVKELFPVQQNFVDRGLLQVRNNACVFGYPGCGKTLVAEMAMANEIQNGGKVLYCTPYRALDWQKYNDFKNWFSPKAKVLIADGDNPVTPSDLVNARIIVATYERILGALRADEEWLQHVTLLCADEITLLADEGRGGNIDFLISYMKLRNKSLRIITLASLIGNPLQVSDWLGADSVIENRPLLAVTVREHLTYRKGKDIMYLSKDGKKHTERFDGDIVEHLVHQNLEKDETTLVFVGARHATEAIAAELKPLHQVNKQLQARAADFFEKEIWEKTELTKKLCDLIGYGIAFHHAGVQRKARKFVEQLLSENLLKTVIATTTLSHGVDYCIDNVIINLPTMKMHELYGYEYINLKGRAGRYGKSKSASIFVITEEEQLEKTFRRYFVGSPEPVLPRSTFSKDVLANIVLIEAAKGDVSSVKVSKTLATTLCASGRRPNRSELNKVLGDLSEFGLLLLKEKQFSVTELGKKVNAANFPPYDIMTAFSLSDEMSDLELIDKASSIDLAKRIRERSLTPFLDDAPDVLMDWIGEAGLDAIKSGNKSTPYNDQDIVELGEYTSLSLQKISSFVSDSKLRERIDLLKERTKFGIKQDLAKSGLMRMPSLSSDRKRGLARRLYDAGYKNASAIAKQQPEKLMERLNISRDLATKIVSDASNSSVKAHGQ